MSSKWYVTKPVEVEAIKFTAESVLDVLEFTMDDDEERFRYGFNKDAGRYYIWAEVYDILHDTWIKVYEGQWIIRGTKGEFYPCDEETFQWKYEEKENESI